MPTNYELVLITVPDKKTGTELSEKLLTARLAACVTVMDGASSAYWWEGKIQHDAEAVMIVKTRAELVPDLIYLVRHNHPYTLPEVISFNINQSYPEFLNWLGANCRADLSAKKEHAGK